MIKQLKYIGLLIFFGVFFSCNTKNLTQEQQAPTLNQMFSAIEEMATSKKCVDASKWTFTSYGSKACGGPTGFIAYSTEIDTELFLKKIEEHKVAQEKFNEKWGIISDCSLPPQPTEVACKNGKPVLIYEN